MMHFRAIVRFQGFVLLFLAGFMLFPLGVSLIYRDGSTVPFLWSVALVGAVGLVLALASGKGEELALNHRDGVLIVSLGWALAGLAGAVPFLVSGAIPEFTHAVFESVSGFTTTGASILSNIEALPQGVLLWRSLTQWLGGMGIIVLSIAVLPFLGVGGMQLYKAEVPSPVVDKLKPRISETAKTLWKVYVLITALEILLLLSGGMSIFDAICHAFCTMPTGGFSPKNASIAHYGSPYLDGVFISFMLLAGINFSLHYRLLKGDTGIYGKDPECRVFLGLVGLSVLLVTLDTHGAVYASLTEAFRYAAFQVSSIITTTGFVTADFDLWPPLSQKILLLSMFLGAMAGSTGGGLKTMRVILLFKSSYREMFRIIHPHAVTSVKLGGRPVPAEVLGSIWGFSFLYMGVYVLACLWMASLGLDMVSAFSSVAACIFNIGPGLGLVGPMRNYLEVPLTGKWVLFFFNVTATTEIYTLLVLLVPEFWRK